MRSDLHPRRPGLLVVIGLTVVLAGCGPSTSPAAHTTSAAPHVAADAFPVTVHTATGPVVVKSRPTAIVSLSPTATEMLYAIGAGHQVKAVDKYSDYPPGTPRTSLTEVDLNVESVIALGPDLIVVDQDEPGLAAQLAKLSIPLLVLPPAQKLGDVYTEITELGAATGHERRAAAEDATLRRRLAAIVASVPKPRNPVTYYYELEPDYYSVTSATFIGQLFGLLGLKSIADAAAGGARANGGYPQLSAEFIVKANPDFIFLADSTCCQATAASVSHRPGWSTIAAVRLHHIVPLNDDIASRWGPRMVVLLQDAATAVKAAGD